MIKRITDRPLIPIEKVESKQLPRNRVIDPTLTPEQKLDFQKQVHQETFAQKALKRLSVENKAIQKLSDNEEEEQNSDEALIQMLAEEEKRRGSKIYDDSAFSRAIIKTLPPEMQEVMSKVYTPPPRDPSRPEVRSLPEKIQEIILKPDTKKEAIEKDKGLQKYIEDESYYKYMIDDYLRKKK